MIWNGTERKQEQLKTRNTFRGYKVVNFELSPLCRSSSSVHDHFQLLFIDNDYTENDIVSGSIFITL